MTLFHAEGDIALHCGDCLEILEGLGGSFDLVIADPPYTTGIASFGEDTKASGWGDIMNSAHFNAAWLRHCRRLTDAKQGSAWVFNSWRSFPILTRASYEIKWPIVSTLVWDKEWIGPGGPQGLRPSYELAALFCHKGFALQNRSLPDIWRHKWHSKKPNGHPAEKPLALYRRIIQETGAKKILDPFCGSGTTLEAAKLEGVSAVGIEIEPSWCHVAVQRLQQQVLSL